MSEITVEELRLGLFCLIWKLNKNNSKTISRDKKTIELCGSQEGHKITITLSEYLKNASKDCSSQKYHYTVTVEETSWKDLTHEEDSKFNPESEVVQDMLLIRSQMYRENQTRFQNYKVPNLSRLFKSQFSRPVYIWLKSIFEQNKDVVLKKVDPFKWENNRISSKMRREYVTLYIDFCTIKIPTITGLTDMFTKQNRCDVFFQFKNGETIGAHILILSAGSPVFAARFQSDVQQAQPRRLTVFDVELKVFHQLLFYLYSGSTYTPPSELEDTQLMYGLYDAADKHDVDSLKMECVNLLAQKIEIKNAIKLLIFAHSRFIPKLFTLAMKFLAKNSRKIILLPEWLDFMRNYPELCVLVTKNMVL